MRHVERKLSEGLPHLVAVILDVFPFGVGGQAMVGAGNIATQFDQGLEPLHLGVDGGVIPGKDPFVHAPHSEKLPTVLLPPGLDAGVPGTDLDGEHGVDAVLEPGGNQGVDFAVTVKGDDVDAVPVDQVRDASVVRPDLGSEQPRVDQGPAPEARKDHAMAYRKSFYPGVRLAGPHTVQFEADDYFEVLRFFSFGLG